MKKLQNSLIRFSALFALWLSALLSVAQNTKYGTNALLSNTTGSSNSAFGYYCLYLNTTGYSNTGVGFQTLYNNSSGFNNTGLGASVLFNNTTGFQNTGIGNLSLISNTTGSNNTANGAGTLFLNTTGSANTATGSHTLVNNTTGSNNTAIGFLSLYSNTSGINNVANGDYAVFSNTTGSYNTATGSSALTSNTTGKNNTANGFAALNSNTAGNSNTATGYLALLSSTTGIGNTATGWSALSNNISGHYNTAIGNNANINSGNLTNSTALGRATLITASNQVRIGSSSITSIGGYTGWSNISDGRYKKNLKENVPGLKFINALKPVTYNLKITELDGWLRRDMRKTDKDAKTSEQQTDAERQAITEKEKIVYTGFVAQEVEKTAKELNYDFSGVDAPKNDHDVYGLRYAEFVVPLVKAVQELSQMNDKLQKQNDFQQKEIDELKLFVASFTQNDMSSKTAASITRVDASIEQNIPNPFAGTTVINYTLPQKFVTAQIIVTDKSGKVVKQVKLSGTGKGTLMLNVTALSSGAYQYSLYVDGKLIATKQMLLAK